jgi:hypothetical protein
MLYLTTINSMWLSRIFQTLSTEDNYAVLYQESSTNIRVARQVFLAVEFLHCVSHFRNETSK